MMSGKGRGRRAVASGVRSAWLCAYFVLAAQALAQTSAFFRIGVDHGRAEILGLHKWGVLVWSYRAQPGEAPSEQWVEFCAELNGSWAILDNGRLRVGHGDVHAQVAIPELVPTGEHSAGVIWVAYGAAVSAGEQGEHLSSLGLTGSPAGEGGWFVQTGVGQEVEWCAILESDPRVVDASVVELTGPVPY